MKPSGDRPEEPGIHREWQYSGTAGRLKAGCTVLIIEDDEHTTELVRMYLARDGHRVVAAADGSEGLEVAAAARPDLVVLDLMLPGLDGMEVCRRLRETTDVPVIMLTARVDEADRLAGLDLGADDYVTKPFSPRELAARVRAVLRRVSREAGLSRPGKMRRGEVTVHLGSRRVRVGERSVALTPTEFHILVVLIREPERVFTREEIIDEVFGYDFFGFDRTVDAHVSNLRRKLRGDGEAAGCIGTVYGVGYRFDRL